MSQHTPNNQSVYTNYNEMFHGYDQARQTNGLTELLEIFSEEDTPLDQQRVLEGGFGTGAYLNQIRHHVQEAYGVEGSDTGYQKALQKVDGATNVHLQIGNILDLSFMDSHFHAYTINQVAHHLDTEPNFPNLDIFLAEAHRVLVSGGVLTINTCSHAQMDPNTGPFWHFQYIENAATIMRARFIPIDDLVTKMKTMGFEQVKLTKLLDKMFNSQYYQDPTYVLESSFKQGDSVYAGSSTDELEIFDARVSAAIEDGTVYDVMERAAKCANEIGEAVIVSARKPNE